MVEIEISQNTKTNYGRTRNIIQIQTRIMVEPEISYKYKHELWQKQK